MPKIQNIDKSPEMNGTVWRKLDRLGDPEPALVLCSAPKGCYWFKEENVQDNEGFTCGLCGILWCYCSGAGSCCSDLCDFRHAVIHTGINGEKEPCLFKPVVEGTGTVDGYDKRSPGVYYSTDAGIVPCLIDDELQGML